MVGVAMKQLLEPTPRASHKKKNKEVSNALMQSAWSGSTYHFAVRNNFLFRTFLEVLKLNTHILPSLIYQCSCILSVLMPNLQSLQFCTFLIQACYFPLFLFKFVLEGLKKSIHIAKQLHTESYCHPMALSCTAVGGYQWFRRHLLPRNQIFRFNPEDGGSMFPPNHWYPLTRSQNSVRI
jgi:hypothetical protein